MKYKTIITFDHEPNPLYIYPYGRNKTVRKCASFRGRGVPIEVAPKTELRDGTDAT